MESVREVWAQTVLLVVILLGAASLLFCVSELQLISREESTLRLFRSAGGTHRTKHLVQEETLAAITSKVPSSVAPPGNRTTSLRVNTIVYHQDGLRKDQEIAVDQKTRENSGSESHHAAHEAQTSRPSVSAAQESA